MYNISASFVIALNCFKKYFSSQLFFFTHLHILVDKHKQSYCRYYQKHTNKRDIKKSKINSRNSVYVFYFSLHFHFHLAPAFVFPHTQSVVIEITVRMMIMLKTEKKLTIFIVKPNFYSLNEIEKK